MTTVCEDTLRDAMRFAAISENRRLAEVLAGENDERPRINSRGNPSDVLAHLTQPKTVEQLSADMERPQKTVMRYLQGLRKEGQVARVRNGQRGKFLWTLA